MKALLALACLSVSSTGCIGLAAVALSSARDSSEKSESEYKEHVIEPFASAQKKFGTLPDDLDGLSEAYYAWNSSLTAVARYEAQHCKGKGGGDRCKTARDHHGKSLEKVAEVLAAAIEAEPEPGEMFPADVITKAQDIPELAALIDVEASLTRLVQHWEGYWAKRIRKAGSAEQLVHKNNRGTCFFSASSDGDEIVPRFAFATSAEDLRVRCVTAAPIASYDRSQKDVVAVKVDSQSGWLNVQSMGGADDSSSRVFEAEVAIEDFQKRIKKGSRDASSEDSGDDDGDGEPANKAPAKPWRFVLADVRYITHTKVGTSAHTVGNQVRFEDNIGQTDIATGIAIIDLEGDVGATADEDASAAADDDDEDAAPAKKAKSASKSKVKTGAKAKGHAKTKRHGKSARRGAHTERSAR